MKRNQKRILLFNAKREKCDSSSPHLGLAMLASVLTERGHEVLVVDYQFNQNAPSPGDVFEHFKPDVVGLTLYTATMKEAEKIIKQLSYFEVPLIVGGPHATLYSNDLIDKANYIVVGEAENIIVELVEKAIVKDKGQIIRSEPPNPKDLPFPNFKAFWGYEKLKNILF